ncbi:MAG: two-component sensor histidine kinase [Rubrivivax sp. SCN 70-15]|nr:MAG: two-component sensor histidine kinase [Rubrivivax sp. SCN 70-15]
MIRAPRSLQGRLLALVLGGVAAVWVVTAAVTWFDVRQELDELLDGHLAQAAALLVVQQSQEFGDGAPDVDAPTLHRYAPKVAFQVFHEGRLVLRSANAPVQPMVTPGERLASGFGTVRIDGTAWRVMAAHGAERDVQVYVGEQASSRASILWAVLRGTLWPMAAALPLLALAAWWAVSHGVSPLRRLGQALAARQPGAAQPVVVDDAPAEMEPVVDALNGLLQRVATMLDSERRFTADAAHELRTPIAAIRAQAQVALAEDDAAQRRHALQATLDGCDRATRLVEQLLTLARLESTTARADRAVDLGAVVRQVAAEIAPKAVAKRQTLRLAAGPDCSVAGDETLLAVLVRNLIDNAVRYSPPAASIDVAVRRDADRVTLTVDDSGPGLAAADLERLGQRFFRVAGSGQDGSGLGWSIVRRIAQAHGMDVTVGRSETLGGLAIRITAAARAAPAQPR